MKLNNVINGYKKYILNTYSRQNLFISKAKGSYVFDENGNNYLDFLTGLSVNSLGHCNPEIVKRIKKESEILLHTSNLYYTDNPLQLAKKLVKNSFPGQVFFCNSGTEANETAIKIIHKYANNKNIKNCEIISFYNSFHGRTFGALSATAQEKYQKSFEPLLPGFKYANYNDFNDFKNKVTKNTAGVILEVIQAEGGIIEAENDFIKKIYQFCKSKKIIIVIDEVQTGIGKTGMKFGYMHYGIQPDIMTLAKALGGGLPIGAAIVSNEYKDILQPGSHASTFGANSLITGVANTVIDIIFSPTFLKSIQKKSAYLKKLLNKIDTNKIQNIRGKGLLIGFDIIGNNKKLVEECLKKKLIINAIADSTIRLSPSLTVSEKEIDTAVNIIADSLKNI